MEDMSACVDKDKTVRDVKSEEIDFRKEFEQDKLNFERMRESLQSRDSHSLSRKSSVSSMNCSRGKRQKSISAMRRSLGK